jgi:hypothetical protein
VKDELLSVQAAAELGVPPRSVQLYIRRGKLPAVPVRGTSWVVIRLKDLDKVRERPKAGRPKKVSR